MNNVIEDTVNVIAEDYNRMLADEDLAGMKIESWSEFLDAIWWDSSDVKEDVYYQLTHNEYLRKYLNEGCYTDDCEIIAGDKIISYRKLMNLVRSKLDYSVTW